MDGMTALAILHCHPTPHQVAARAWAEAQAAALGLGRWEFFAPDFAPDAFVMVALDDGWARVGRRAADGSWHWGGPAMPLPYWGKQ